MVLRFPVNSVQLRNRFGCFLLLPVLLIGQISQQSEQTVQSGSLELVFTGDVMLAGSATHVFNQRGADFAFDSTRSILKQADLVCINLEAPFTLGGVAFNKTYTFRANPDHAVSLANAGVAICTLANNHILDYGEEGLFDTFEILNQNKISYCGAGKTSNDALQGIVVTKQGIRVGFLSFSLTYPEAFWATQTRPGTLYPTENRLRKGIQKLNSCADYVVITFHWGQELMSMPKAYQRRFAKLAIDLGADVVVGHHPHVPQGIEVYRGHVIAYSLGNYVFGSYSNKVKNGLLFKVVFSENHIQKAQIIPIVVNNHEVHLQPRMLRGNSKKQCIDELNLISEALNDNHPILNLDGFVQLEGQ